MQASWLNDDDPYRAPVDTVDADGRTNSYGEEIYRPVGFRFYRLATTLKGGHRACACESVSN